MKVVGFDLDDTLYSHWDYEKHLYKGISEIIESKFGYDRNKMFEEMHNLFKQKAFDKLFDTALLNAGYELPGEWNEFVKSEILPFYRNHKPDTKLNSFEWVFALFKKIRDAGYKLVLITNGRVSIQKNKIELLNLLSEFDKIYISDEINPPMRKPGLKIFETVLNDFNIKPEEMIYVGDSIEKDGSCEKLGINFLLHTDHKKLYEVLDIIE